MSRSEAIIAEMEGAIRFLGADEPSGGKRMIRSAARKISAVLAERISETTLRDLLYRRIKRPQADVVDTIRDAVAAEQAARREREDHQQFVIEARLSEIERRQREVDDMAAMADRLAAIERRLDLLDADVGGEEADRIRRVSKRMRDLAA